MVPFEKAIAVSYKLSIVTIALSRTMQPQSAIECLRLSSQQGVGHFWTKYGEEEADRCKPNFNANWERHEAVLCKRNTDNIFCRFSTMHECDRQTTER